MDKRKTALVTALIAILAAFVIGCMYLLKLWVIFGIIVGVFAIYGYSVSAVTLYEWLCEKPTEKRLDPIAVETPVEENDDFTATYDEIKSEVLADM